MADNTQLNAGTGGDTIATDDIAGVKYQRVKLALGADGAAVDAEAGAGAVSTAVQRVTLASDDPAVTALQVLDNAISGSEMQVDVVAALPAGTNNIGDVDVLSLVPGTGATALGKAVDSAAGATDTGVAILAIRDDTLSTLTPVDGDYVPLRVSSTGALHVTGSAATTQYTEDGASAGGESLCLMGGVRRDTAASSAGTDGDYATVNLSSSGRLYVDATISGGGIAGIVDDAAFTPGTSEVLPIGFTFDDTTPDSVNEGDIGAARMSANRNIYVTLRDAAGNERGLNVDASGQVAVTLAASQTLATLTNITNWGNVVDDAAFTPATTRVLMVGFEADETATDSVDEGDGGAARMTLDRKVITTTYAHAAAGGHTPFKSLDLDESEEEIKGSGGKLFWVHAMNLHASATRYLKIYNNTAAGVTVGTTVPDLTFPIPANVNGFAIHFGDAGLSLGTGITVAATTGFADNDTGAPGANEVVLNAGYL